MMELHVTDRSGRELIVHCVDKIYSGVGAGQFAVQLKDLPTGIYIYKLVSLDSAAPVGSLWNELSRRSEMASQF